MVWMLPRVERADYETMKDVSYLNFVYVVLHLYVCDNRLLVVIGHKSATCVFYGRYFVGGSSPGL